MQALILAKYACPLYRVIYAVTGWVGFILVRRVYGMSGVKYVITLKCYALSLINT